VLNIHRKYTNNFNTSPHYVQPNKPMIQWCPGSAKILVHISARLLTDSTLRRTNRLSSRASGVMKKLLAIWFVRTLIWGLMAKKFALVLSTRIAIATWRRRSARPFRSHQIWQVHPCLISFHPPWQPGKAPLVPFTIHTKVEITTSLKSMKI